MEAIKNLIIPPFPEGEEVSSDFSIKVNGYPVSVYTARVSAVPFNQTWPGYQRPLDQTELASFAYWDMAESVTVEIISEVQIKSVSIKPSSFKIIPTVNGNKITFTLLSPKHITVEVNGSHKALHLFVNPIEKKQIDKNDPKVKYFGLGIHRAGKIVLNSDETLYIDAGAIVYGAVEVKRASNVKILGRGILDTSAFNREDVFGSISLYKCSNIEIDGIIIRDPNMWTVIPAGCQDVKISNIKLIGLWRYNADGIDIVNSQHVRIEKCFIRSFDDGIVVKGIEHWGLDKTNDQNVEDVVISECVIWCDWGRALEIGAETSADVISDISFKDCHIIRTTHIALDIQHGDRASIHNVKYENIFIEVDELNLEPVMQYSKEEKYTPNNDKAYCPELINIGINMNYYSTDDTCGQIRDVYFKNISVLGKHFPKSFISGLDEEHTIENVTIENLVINDKGIKSAKEGCICIGDFTKGISVLI